MYRSALYASINFILLNFSLSAVAADTEEDIYLLYGDEEMISIATGVSQPIDIAPSTASVITAKDIQAMGAMTIDEVLERVPGLHVEPSTLNRMDSIYTFRGLYTGLNPQVLFMLNGSRVSSYVYNGTLPPNMRINVQNISRIEVVRGPGSAVYGADAYAGVINIITKSTKELNGTNFGVRGGSFNTKNVWVQYGGDISREWDIAVNVEYANQDADKSRIVDSDAQTLADGGFSTSASLAPDYLDRRYEALTYNVHLNNEYWEVSFDGWAQRDNGIGAGAAQALDHEGKDDTDQWLMTAQYSNNDIIENWDIIGKFSYQYIDTQAHFTILPPGSINLIGADGNIDVATPGVPVQFSQGLLGNPGSKNIIPQVDLIGVYDGVEHHTWRFNIGAKREEFEARETKNSGPGVLTNPAPGLVVDGLLTNVTGTPFVYAPDKNRTIKYISVQDIWSFAPDWILTTGVRYDDYSDFGDTVNPRVALVWTTTQQLITKLLYGSAFRAPSFSELFSQNNPIVTGNRNLDPETIDTLELSFSYDFLTDLKANLNVYAFETENMIEFVGDISTKVAQNEKTLEGEGFELEIDWQATKDLYLMFNYANQSTKNKSTGIQEPFSTQSQAYLDIRWAPNPEWLISSQINWVSERDREVGDNRPRIDDYHLVNLTLRNKSLVKNWEFAVTVNNVFDENAKEPSGLSNGVVVIDDYPLNERAIFLEARYEM